MTFVSNFHEALDLRFEMVSVVFWEIDGEGSYLGNSQRVNKYGVITLDLNQ